MANQDIINKFISKLSALKGKKVDHFSLSKEINNWDEKRNLDSILEMSKTIAKFKQMNEIIDFANEHMESEKETNLQHEERVLEEA